MNEKRAALRFEKVIPVSVESEDFGPMGAIARNVSEGGMMIETPSPMPLGSEVRVRFLSPDGGGSIVVRAEVKNHYALNYSGGHARGMGVRFLEFLADGAERLAGALEPMPGIGARWRTLH